MLIHILHIMQHLKGCSLLVPRPLRAAHVHVHVVVMPSHDVWRCAHHLLQPTMYYTTATATATQGTMTHMAPEVLLQGKLSRASDVYAYGGAWEMCGI